TQTAPAFCEALQGDSGIEYCHVHPRLSPPCEAQVAPLLSRPTRPLWNSYDRPHSSPHPKGIPGGSPSTSPHMWRMPERDPGHVLSQKITGLGVCLGTEQGLKAAIPGQTIRPDGSGALIIVLDANDVVLAEIAAGLDFDQL